MDTPLSKAPDQHGDSPAGQDMRTKAPQLRWWVLSAVGASSVCGGMSAMIFAPLIGEVAQDVGVSIGAASFAILGLAAFVTSLAMGVVGFFVDRVGVFKVMLAGQLLLALSIAAMPLAGHEYNAIVALRLLQGLGGACLIAIVTPVLARWFDRSEIGRAMGVQAIGMPLGLMLALNVAPMLTHQLGSWRWGVAFMALVPLAAFLLTLPIAAAAKNQSPAASSGGLFAPQAAGGAGFMHLPLFWIGLFSTALFFAVGFAFTSLTPGFLAVAPPVGAGYGAEGSGAMMFVHGLAGAVAPPLGGFLLDKVLGGRARVLVSLGWVLSLVLYTSVIVPPIFGDRTALMAVLLIAGFANPFINVTMMSYAAKTFPTEILGRVSGLWLSVGTLAGSGGVMAGALALQATGDYRMAFLMIGVGSAIGLALAQFLRAPPRSSDEPSLSSAPPSTSKQV